MTIGPTQKSTYITNSDATPRVATTAGEGAGADFQAQEGYVTPAAADAAGTKYLMLRVPSNAVVKRLTIANEAQGAGKVNCGVYYPDDIRDMAPSNSANLGLAVDDDFFATDVDLAAKVQPTDITFESGTYTFDKWVQPLWQAAGLSADPGGKLDIVLTVHTTDVTTGTGKLLLRGEFVSP
jgi:hypothetical protein